MILARWLPAALAALAGFALPLAAAAPASAHGADAPGGADYRSTVTGIIPATPGLAARTVEAGARVELTNRSGHTIEVLGYSGEPYLELRPDGVYENTHSPATYLNRTLAGNTPLPPEADPTAPPAWRRTSTSGTVRWHDHRAYYMSAAAPPQTRTDPTRPHRIQNWTVPLRDGATPIQINGTLDWLPPPEPALWWACTLLAAAALAALAWRTPRAVSAALATLGGLAALAYAVAHTIEAGAPSTQLWPVLSASAALAAAGYTLTRGRPAANSPAANSPAAPRPAATPRSAPRPAADFALALSGACLAIFAGFANAAVFVHAVTPTPGSPTLARTAILTVIATGAALAAAGTLRLRSTHPTPDPKPPASIEN